MMICIRNCLNDKGLRLLIVRNSARVSSRKCDHVTEFCTLASVSDVEVVAKRIRVGGGEDEILSSLMNDEEVCRTISVNRVLVETLLRRFKDDWKSALGVYKWAESRPFFEHSTEACDLMVDILGKARQFDRMRELVGRLGERNLVSLNTLAKVMRRFAGARRWKEAVRTFDELGNFGLEKNSESMNLLLDTLCKEKQVEMARDIFLELKSHISPTAHTFNIFVHGWCKIKRVEEAHWTLQEMKGYGFSPSVMTYSIIIWSYCQQANWAEVYELLEVMEAQGCQPSVVTYTAVMSSLAKSDQLEDALRIADKVKSSGCKLDTLFYNALIYTLGKAQRIWVAFDVFKVEMPANGVIPSTVTYNTLISMFCHHGQEQMALSILKDMEKEAIKPDLQTFYPLLKACFNMGMIDNCLSKLLDDMVIKHHLSLDTSTYSLLIHGLCRVDRCEWALQLFEEMIAKGLTPMFHTGQLLLDKVKQRNLYDAAERVDVCIKHLKASKKPAFPVPE